MTTGCATDKTRRMKNDRHLRNPQLHQPAHRNAQGMGSIMKIKRLIASESDRQRVMAEIAMMPLDSVKMIQFGDATRTDIQNAKFHSICGDASKQAKWIGRILELPQWKCLFVSGHAIATGLGADMVPGLEGEFVNIRESTAQMGVKRMSSCIEYTQAWCYENGVRLSTPRWMDRG